MLKVAFFTPLHPIKSGIADYAEEMLPYLKKYIDIDLFVDDCVPSEQYTAENFKIYQLSDYENIRNNYDITVYQMGNNKYHHNIYYYTQKYPGIVILHDFAIHHTMAYIKLEMEHSWEGYFDEVEYNHGLNARILAMDRYCKNQLGLWETDALTYPMNKRVFSKALGAIVFSEYAKNRISKYGLNIPIERIYLHCGDNKVGCSEEKRIEARKWTKLPLKDDDILLGVFGFITEAKRPYAIIEALKNLKSLNRKIYVAFVGELSDSCKDIKNLIHEYGLSDYVSFTGFADIETFKTYIVASDICISLRYPTMGETSGVFMRALSQGKPSIVSDVGTFSEAPSEVAIKISTGENEVAELTEGLKKLITDRDYYDKMSSCSIEFAEQHLKIEDTAKSIVQYLENVVEFEKIKKTSLYDMLKEDCLLEMSQVKIDKDSEDRTAKESSDTKDMQNANMKQEVNSTQMKNSINNKQKEKCDSTDLCNDKLNTILDYYADEITTSLSINTMKG